MSQLRAVHVSDFDTLVPAPELSFGDVRNNPFRNMTTIFIGNDSSGEGTRVSKSDIVDGSFVAGTSAASPDVPRKITS